MLGIFLISCREIESEETPQLVKPSMKVHPTDRQWDAKDLNNRKQKSFQLMGNIKDTLKTQEILFKNSDSLDAPTEKQVECCGDHGQIPIKN